MGDVARSNALFGGAHAVLAELEDFVRPSTPGSRAFSLLDVGTGLGDIPARVRARAAQCGVTVDTVGLDTSEALAVAAHDTNLPMLRADARRMPIADRAFDVVLCSQVLHHFRRDDGIALLRELDRVARRRIVVSDIRRSWLAAAGIWLASWPLRFHPVSRHDGVVSVLRGFTPDELAGLVQAAIGVAPRVRRHRGFRVTAAWAPAGGPAQRGDADSTDSTNRSW